MPRAKSPTTIKDLARELNLSVSTVSYALNGGPRSVSEEVRERVLRAAERLEYRPSRIARTLVTRRTHTLGVVIPTPDRNNLLVPFHHVAITAFATTLEELGYDMLMYTRPERLTRESLLHSFTDGRTDGLVIFNPLLDSRVILGLERIGFPCALVSRRIDTSIPQFVSDNRDGIRQAIEHLWQLGHRKIGYLYGDLRQFDAQERLDAYMEAMKERGAPALVGLGMFNAETTRCAALEMLRTHRPTAILTSHDDSAPGVYAAAQEMGLSIPRDLSVIGYDDIPNAALRNPELTTVRQPIYRMAADAARAVIHRLETGGYPSVSRYGVELVVRGSTGPAPE
jgi:DNA-binding LacI/PurR family transcriptional regulator